MQHDDSAVEDRVSSKHFFIRQAFVLDQTALAQDQLGQHPWHLFHHVPKPCHKAARNVGDVIITSLLDTPMSKESAWGTRVVIIQQNAICEGLMGHVVRTW